MITMAPFTACLELEPEPGSQAENSGIIDPSLAKIGSIGIIGNHIPAGDNHFIKNIEAIGENTEVGSFNSKSFFQMEVKQP
jgi:hypothetical protein